MVGRRFIPKEAFPTKEARNAVIVEEIRMAVADKKKVLRTAYQDIARKYNVSWSFVCKLAAIHDLKRGPNGKCPPLPKERFEKNTKRMHEQDAAVKSSIVVDVKAKLDTRKADNAGRYYAPPPKRRFYVQGSIKPPTKTQLMGGR